MQHSVGKVESLLSKWSPCAPPPQGQITAWEPLGSAFGKYPLALGFGSVITPSPQPAVKSGMHSGAIANVCGTQI